MTIFGIYLVSLNILGVMLNFFYAGRGGVEYEPGVLIFAGIWGLANILGILLLGTGSL